MALALQLRQPGSTPPGLTLHYLLQGAISHSSRQRVREERLCVHAHGYTHTHAHTLPPAHSSLRLRTSFWMNEAHLTGRWKRKLHESTGCSRAPRVVSLSASSPGLGKSPLSLAFSHTPNPSGALRVRRSWLVPVFLTHVQVVIHAESPAYREAPPEELDASPRSLRTREPLTVSRSFLASDPSPCGCQNNACCCLLLGGNMTEGRQAMRPWGWGGHLAQPLTVTLCSVPNFSGSQFYGF